jgi:DNA-binding GntR family transcriptional regulator
MMRAQMNNDIYEKIKWRILYLQYEPGQSLDEKEIAKEFGISRTPVREAVKQLEWERLIEVVPRGGVFVTKLDLQHLREVFHVRKILEAQLARLAALNRKDDHIKGLKKLRSICSNSKAFNKPKDLMDIDIKMRKILYDATKAPMLSQITDMLYCQTFRLWLMVFDKLGMIREVGAQINELDHFIKVLSNQDPDGAQKISVQLFDNYIERIKLYLTQF